MRKSDVNHGLNCPITGESEDLILLSQTLTKTPVLYEEGEQDVQAFHESVTLAQIQTWEEEQLQGRKVKA